MDRHLYSKTLAPLLFVSALLAGVSFWPMSHVLSHGAGFIAWKTVGVALLALWALLVARDGAGKLLATALAFSALGDALLEISRTWGGAAFLASHGLAFTLYRTRRRADRQALGLAIALVIPLIAWLLTRDIGVLVYACGLGAMTGSAWASRLPRHQVALGASMFAVSDLLIFAHFDVLRDSMLPPLLIWPLYFGGQALIAWGAGRALAQEAR
ncbi:lysoplasmalogenase [soil metagenome]